MSTQNISLFQKMIHFTAQGFGSGLIPFAPGTMGTIASIPFYFLLRQFSFLNYAIFVVLAFLVGVWICDVTGGYLNQADPRSVVWDEMVGFWITLWFLPNQWLVILIGFVLFRFFDIAKPWPVSWADQKLKGGLGIMLDDVLAGIYAGLLLFGIVQVLCYASRLSCEYFR